jgi:hypothetical protein
MSRIGFMELRAVPFVCAAGNPVGGGRWSGLSTVVA